MFHFIDTFINLTGHVNTHESMTETQWARPGCLEIKVI